MEELRKNNLNGSIQSQNHQSICVKEIVKGSSFKSLNVTKGRVKGTNEDNNISSGIFSKAKILAKEAVKKKMIFSIYGPYEKIRCALKDRGWIEKKLEEKMSNSNQLKPKFSQDMNKNVFENNYIHQNEPSHISDQLAENGKGDIELHEIASQLVFDATPDFIWSLKMVQIDMKNIKPNQIINHFRNAGSFTTKSGLIKSFNSLRWFEKDPDEIFPRSYIISDENETKAFLNDYYLTACLSMLQLVSEAKDYFSDNLTQERNNNYDHKNCDINNSKYEIKKVIPNTNYENKDVDYDKYNIDQKYIEMALHFCEMYSRNLKNKDLDNNEVTCFSDSSWIDFFEYYWNISFEDYEIECSESSRKKCQQLYYEIKDTQQSTLNGTKNIWIIKPGAKSRGRGILCISKYSELKQILQSNSDDLIIQKYIERPLLIYNTKFDIRQWFLVTSWSPLTIWWYKDSYIRFCSQQFTLKDFNEAVHLSNNSIQYKYLNGPRSMNLPPSNMWHWKTLQNYLNKNGYENGWNKMISPSMKNTIIDILLCSQEEIEDRKNSFELYGADFMVTEGDLKTWLLEINSSPCMAPTTDVTAKLTKSVLEDVIKVILDYPKDIYCDTGQFELLYKQAPFMKSMNDQSIELTVIGNGIKKPKIYRNIFLNEIRKDKKLIFDENSILKNKLKQIIENSTIQTYDTFDESMKQCQYKIHQKPKNESDICKGLHKQEIKYGNSQFMDSKRISNELFIHKSEEVENLPILNSNGLKSIYVCPDNKKILTKNKKIRTTSSFDNSFMPKLNFLKLNEGNKRFDQLIKVYLPNFSR